MACRFLCSNVSEVPLQFGYFAHLVRIIASALASNEQIVVTTVIRNTKTVFCSDYNGSLVLVPLYLEKIREILRLNSSFGYSTKSAAVSILGSLICLPDQYPDYVIPPISEGAAKMTMPEVKEKVHDLIWLLIKESNTALETLNKASARALSKAICCAFLVIHQEAAKSAPQIDTIKVL